ncbi:hypothetical protein A2755_03950 [Candidatus Wolfebacteria bacterium RIFCSPHIGHO2_01_FULL_48_22]|uniref:Serine hydroxymethyltransferase n=2 Tax=Candidatus Wolfeibacteriota TaxID=1752735 RepID=A0A1F8DR74_9BACT|nr:MAG: hypothetical protein A2755_03950 [Candidatus Wolfebacteria bacterium RIFCSPHIGHO2_01_FULL_48_22]OGM93491.1 MAG: hypothetical protein A2935_01300 [Candidatus Wolfebacteria bacterium RIFCSPLOWO2_01_FULL_47_17b]
MKFPKEKDIIEGIIKREEKRQEESLNLIASENHIPAYIRAASGSVLMHKYAEGYPGKRYYPGTMHYDHIEKKATERALKLFNLSKKQWHVNAQPYSGAVANMELYLAFLKQGDTILSMALKSGGHLSHGSSVSHTGKLFHIEHYGVTEKYDIDYAELKKKAVRYKPKLIVSGASAFPKKIDFKKIGAIAKSIGALHLADISHYAGLISAGVYLSPFGYADMVMTTTHKSLFGPRGALLYVKKEFAQTLDTSVFPGMQGGPHMHTIAGIAMGLEFARENKEYYRQVIKNAKALAFALKKKGHRIIGGGTDSHLVLIDVTKKGIDGSQAERKLETCGIYANRNAVQGDASVQKPSAIRLGTYATSYRGMKEKEMKRIAECIDQALGKGNFYANIQKRVKELTREFPVPEN